MSPRVDDASSPTAILARIVERGAHAASRAWLQERTVSLTGASTEIVQGIFTSAGRRFAAAAFEPLQSETEMLARHGLMVARWTAARAARVLLLFIATRHLPDPAALVVQIYRTGDNDERIAVLSALPMLGHPERYAELAIDACRTHVTTVFEAIACGNAYPSLFFPEPAFNQMVLKALFLELPTARIVGLSSRFNGDLLRMITAYADERRAAGRSIPKDVGRIVELQEVSEP